MKRGVHNTEEESVKSNQCNKYMYPLSDNRYFHLFTEYEGWTNKMKHRAKTAMEHSTVANASGHTHITPPPPPLLILHVLLTENALLHF